MNGFLDERRRIGMAPDEIVLETGSGGIDMHAIEFRGLG
jgi:hypothetical protein